MSEVLKETIRLLERQQPAVWATIVAHKGSTPRKAAARMLIREGGKGVGTIGGGRFEAEAIRSAEARYQQSHYLDAYKSLRDTLDIFTHITSIQLFLSR